MNLIANSTEALFYSIGTARTATELNQLRELIDDTTNDLDERVELENQINQKFALWNATEVQIKSRWN